MEIKYCKLWRHTLWMTYWNHLFSGKFVEVEPNFNSGGGGSDGLDRNLIHDSEFVSFEQQQFVVTAMQ